MKKICKVFVLTTVFVLCCFCPTGCSVESEFSDEFRMVSSITIVTGGETKKFGTTTSPIVDIGDYMVYKFIEDPNAKDEEEFAAAPEERKFYDVAGGEKRILTDAVASQMSKISFEEAVKAANGATYYEIVEPELEGYYYFKSRYTPKGNTYYGKMKYSKTHFNFTYVKVKSDTTIIIKIGKGETTYQVTSYSIIEL